MQIDFLFGRVPDIPIANISAALFYLLCIATVFKPIRRYFGERLQTPIPSTGIYLEPLDSLRGLAALWIAASHSAFYTYPIFKESIPFGHLLGVGSKAIGIFCVLSGLLIWRSVKKMETLESLTSYLHRRVLRIYPLYFATLTIVVVIQIVPTEPGRLIFEYLMLRSFMPAQTLVLPHVWSLYVEVIFYATAPLMALVFRDKALWIAIALTIILFAAGPFGARELTIVPYFFVGIALAEILDKYGKNIPQWAGVLAFLIGAILFKFDITNDWIGQLLHMRKAPAGFTVGLALACFFIVLGVIASRPIAFIFSLPPMRILGTISYSVFMLHPIFIYFCFPPAVLGNNAQGKELLMQTLPVATGWYLPLVFMPGIFFWSIISYIAIELPFLRRRKKPSAVSMEAMAAP